MDAPTAAALDALNAVGARLKEAKASSSAGVDAILAEYQAAKAALEALVRPAAEAAKGSDEALYEADAAFEKVMTKSEKKKRDRSSKRGRRRRRRRRRAGARSRPPARGRQRRSSAPGKGQEEGGGESQSQSRATSSPTPNTLGGDDKDKRAKTSSLPPSGVAAAAPRFAAPIPPRVSVAGRVDPARAPEYAVRQVLVCGELAAGKLPFSISLGRFQTSNLFTDVPSLDTPGNDGQCISGQGACATPHVFSLGRASSEIASAEWQGWAAASLAPLHAALAPAESEIGVVFASVSATKAEPPRAHRPSPP